MIRKKRLFASFAGSRPSLASTPTSRTLSSHLQQGVRIMLRVDQHIACKSQAQTIVIAQSQLVAVRRQRRLSAVTPATAASLRSGSSYYNFHNFIDVKAPLHLCDCQQI